MIALILAATLSGAPTAVYVADDSPPRILDAKGSAREIGYAEHLASGVVCLTPDKAKSIRDDLVAKNTELGSLRKSVGELESKKTSTLRTAVIVAAIALAVGAAAGAGIAVAVKR